MSEIDPVKFGLLIGQVKTLEAQVDDMQRDIKQLLALANHSKRVALGGYDARKHLRGRGYLDHQLF